ncbi:MAG TPA: methyltransferase [Pseudonocardia sp.]|jgi:methylase of polypeptide subunit release factors|nr:methyltransferase [Pseudonocardia sp.]
MLPRFTPELCAGLRTAFLRTGYHVDGVPELLGGAAHAALGRDEPVPARIAASAGGPLGALIRLFLLGDAVPEDEVADALAPVTVPEAVAAGLLAASADGSGLVAALDVRPHGDDGGSWWVVSDTEAGRLTGRHEAPEADHVLGVGHASLSLAAATVRKPVGRLLDLGTGCGVQALHAARHARQLVATDVNERALALAAGTFGLSGVDVDLRSGSWLEPVTGERFDQIITNPPFVAGPARVRHTYRDSGLAGDGVAARLVGTLPELLTDGGIAQLLACWLHVRGEDWPDRVVSWLPATIGVDAWFVQREATDPAHYVGTWLRDSGVDPASPVGQREAQEWLAWFEQHDVEAIGFGFILLRRTGAEPTVLCEDLREGLIDPLGVESAGWLDRVDWLREHHDDTTLLAARLSLAPSVVLEQTSTPGIDGWTPRASTVRRIDGPGWRHDVDGPAAALLAGCQGALPLGELFELLAFAHDRPTDELVAAALPSVREFVRHGLLVPSEWAS